MRLCIRSLAITVAYYVGVGCLSTAERIHDRAEYNGVVDVSGQREAMFARIVRRLARPSDGEGNNWVLASPKRDCVGMHPGDCCMCDAGLVNVNLANL